MTDQDQTDPAATAADPREAQFLASQKERLANNKRQKNVRQEYLTGRIKNKEREEVGEGDVNNNEKGNVNNNHDDVPSLLAEHGANRHHNVTSSVENGKDGHRTISTSDTAKEEAHQFWSNFRKICTIFQSQIDTLLLVPHHPSASANNNNASNNATSNNTNITTTTNNNNHDHVKSHYATAARRNEGRSKLDSMLEEVRSLRRHCLSSSSSIVSTAISNSNTENDEERNDNNENNDNNNNDSKSTNNNTTNNTDSNINNSTSQLLQSILQTPLPEIISQTELRLLSQELQDILNYIDVAREIISPKEKFVFRRYRHAMAERKQMEDNENEEDGNGSGRGDHGKHDASTMDNTTTAISSAATAGAKEEREQENSAKATNYGRVLENMSNCTIEILSDGTLVRHNIMNGTGTTLKDQTRPCDKEMGVAVASPSIATSTSPSVAHTNATIPTTNTTTPTTQSSSSSNSYLLQNLTNLTLILHPPLLSLHLQHIQNCRIYATQPTLGPVHVTDCHSSQIRCSSYQLRVHDSTNVKFCVWARSGPIIEDCKGMVFEGGYYTGTTMHHANDNDDDGGPIGRNMFWDVKDFNWLRALRKSPNFEVITTSSTDDNTASCREWDVILSGNIATSTVSETGSEKLCSLDNNTNKDLGSEEVAQSVPPAEEEDSEDEL